MSENKAFYLPGLNGIRAIAALLVVFSHINLRIDELGFPKGKGIDMASQGVTMFFVLSGFLITALLLKESDNSGSIALRKFYLRRILRIWPLYYLVFICTVFWLFLTNEPFQIKSLFYYGFFLANVPFVFGGTISTIVQFWSVAVEEQFYLFWPWLFRWKKNLHLIMLGIIIIYLLLRFILRFVENGNLYTFLGVIQFHCMAIGGLGAWTIHNKKNFIKKLFKPAVQVICWAILAISLFQPIHVFSIIDSELYAIIFIIIILNVSTNPKTLIKLDHPVLNWLGKISYGIYVYHMIAIIIGFKIFRMLFQVSPGREYIAYVLVIATTLIIAQISYNYFESWFLIKKSKFAVIQSTNVKKDINRPGDHKDCTSVSSLSGSVIT